MNSHEAPSPAPEPAVAGAFTIPLETGQHLSASLLWKAQRNYFDREGVEAWRTDTVPHYITNNPALARAYAEVALGFLRDCTATASTCGGSAWRAFDPSEPLYILELGSGSGRFAFLFLQAFLELRRRSPFAGVPVCYIMTDFTQSNLAFWRNHESLQPYFAQGVLDMAQYDFECQPELRLERGQRVLGREPLRNPLMVIANYVLDGIPQDVFAVRNGTLCECLVSLFSDRPDLDLNDPEVFHHMAVSYTERPLESGFYDEPEFNEILAEYARNLNDTTLLFPCSALRGIRKLAELADNRLLLLTADKGQTEEESLDGRGNPTLTLHGSFSMPVNYHALGQFFRMNGGLALHTPRQSSALATAAFLLGNHPQAFIETRLAHYQGMECGGAVDFYTHRQGIGPNYDKLELKHLLSLIRLSGWDPKILGDCLPALWPQLDQASEPQRKELLRAIERVWQNYYCLHERRDLASELGSVLYGLKEFSKSLELFEESFRLYGDDANTLWTMGLCYIGLHRPEEAAKCFDRMLRLNPTFKTAAVPQARPDLR